MLSYCLSCSGSVCLSFPVFVSLTGSAIFQTLVGLSDSLPFSVPVSLPLTASLCLGDLLSSVPGLGWQLLEAAVWVKSSTVLSQEGHDAQSISPRNVSTGLLNSGSLLQAQVVPGA